AARARRRGRRHSERRRDRRDGVFDQSRGAHLQVHLRERQAVRPLLRWAVALLAVAARVAMAGNAAPTASAAGEPSAAVRETVDAVLAILADPALDADTRRTRTLALVERRFDFREMTRRTLATNWRRASEA